MFNISILGPLLFNACINDIVNINENVKHIIYSDDTSLCIFAPEANVLIAAGNTTSEKLRLSFAINGLEDELY